MSELIRRVSKVRPGSGGGGSLEEETEEGRGGKGNEVTKERMGEGVKREIASKFQLLVLTTADHE